MSKRDDKKGAAAKKGNASSQIKSESSLGIKKFGGNNADSDSEKPASTINKKGVGGGGALSS